MLKLFGVLDLFACILVILYQFRLFENLLLIFSVYLVIKGFFIFDGLISKLDGFAGIMFLLIILGFTTFITWILFIVLMQKALFTLFL